jgi:cysteine sulfinate desulfinase/cysteine desulfurase-like protein
VGRLARKSYKLHQDLAQALGAEQIGYRPLETISLSAAAPRAPGGKGRPRLGAALPGWLDGGGVVATSRMGTHETTAQVGVAL